MEDISPTPVIQPLIEENYSDVIALLQSEELPTDDLSEENLNQFLGIYSTNKKLIGVVGLEAFPPFAMLRSLVINRNFRGKGYAQALVKAIENRVTKNAIPSLFLLTTTAEDFFQKSGYKKIERSEVPIQIKKSSQYSSLCPSSAVCMRKEF